MHYVAASNNSEILVLIITVIGFLFVVVCGMLLSYGRLWLQARWSGAPVSFFSLIGMSIRRISSGVIVTSLIMAKNARLDDVDRPFLENFYLQSGNVPVLVESLIMAKQAGLTVHASELAAHHLAGGNVLNVVKALIAADKANMDLSFKSACSIDLAGRDIVDAVNTSVDPRVIDCPKRNSAKDSLDAVAKDGIQVKVRARVTVRTCLARLVGGATDDTIIARVGEGIVSAIGSAASYTQVLENPNMISEAVQSRGLDAGTAYEILSIDIADVDVGENIGAKLEIDRAHARTRVAQADAEKRAAEARAAELEQQARIAEMRAKVVEAEAEIPLAMAESFRSGNLGIMDYYRMRNIQADTDMRATIGSGDSRPNLSKE